MIKKLTYNWHQTGNVGDGIGDNYYSVEVGKECSVNKLVVKEIYEHISEWDGDKWYYDVIYENLTEMRIFNPNTVLKTRYNSIL